MKKNDSLTIFTLFIVFLFLLRSAGYFQPYFAISVNFIVMVSIILTYFILKLTSKAIFVITLIFWLFAGFLKIIHIDIWSERTGIYVFESLFIGIVISIFEITINQLPRNRIITKLPNRIRKRLNI